MQILHCYAWIAKDQGLQNQREENNMNYLGKYLRKKLKELKVSERELSAKCGISHSYLNQLIKGVNPSTKKNISPTLATFEKLSKGLGVSVDYLQRAARGLESDGNGNYQEKHPHIIDDENGSIPAQKMSSELIEQINDFQNFISLIGLNNKVRTEKEWGELIYDLKYIINKHIQEKEFQNEKGTNAG